MDLAYFSMSYECNEKCIFCPCSENARDIQPLSLDEMKRSVDIIVAKGPLDIAVISGGEPTLKKEFLDFAAYLAGKNIRIGLLSNSLKFASKRYLDQLLAITGPGMLEVTTAFHSHLATKHDRLTCQPKSFVKSLQGVLNVVEAGVKLSVKYNLINYTYRELPDYIDWVYQTFPDKVNLILCNIDLTGIALKNKEFTAVSFADSAPLLEQALDKVIDYQNEGRIRNVRVFDTPLCTLDPYYWDFVESGAGTNVSALRIPSDSPEKDRLYLDVESDSGTLFEPCNRCEVRDICPGTWRKTGEYFGDEIFQPIEDTI
ncbi:MAG: radical SAM protein [Lentimicrobium sp.]